MIKNILQEAFILKEKGYYNVCLSNVTMYHHESKSRGYEDTKEKPVVGGIF